MPRSKVKASQSAITRALKAANAAGGNWAVEVLPDGTIRIIQAADPKNRLASPPCPAL